jgi:hypothetical protein
MRSPPHPLLGTRPGSARLRGRAARDRAAAEALLGPTHPLVGLLRASRTALEQTLVIAAVDLVAGVLLYRAAPAGPPLAIAASIVLVVEGVRLAVLQQSTRDVCVDMIIEGVGRPPLRAVEREWRRFEDPRHLASLARSLDEVVDTAWRPVSPIPSSRPLFSVRVVRPVAPQLSEIARLLRTDSPPVRGVALIERLITSGASPLYGTDVELLRDELRRTRYLLTT